MSKFKPNDQIWFYEHGAVCSGKIHALIQFEDITEKTLYIVYVETIGGTPCNGRKEIMEDQLFPDKASCVQYMNARPLP